MSKGVILHSGGIDSTVMLTKLLSEGHQCFPLAIRYGQRHAKELDAAKAVWAALGINTGTVLDLSNLRQLIKSALHGFGKIPHGHYSDEIQAVTVSPNRNMILLAIAAGYAETIGGDFVAYAAHSNDRAIYPDCRPEFVKSAAETLHLGTGGKITLIEPFVDYTKADVVAEGLRLNAPLSLTWSCYEGHKTPCLQCGTCLERTEAFDINNTADPALSDTAWLRAQKYLSQYTKR